MSTHNKCFHGEIRKIAILDGCRRALSGTVFQMAVINSRFENVSMVPPCLTPSPAQLSYRIMQAFRAVFIMKSYGVCPSFSPVWFHIWFGINSYLGQFVLQSIRSHFGHFVLIFRSTRTHFSVNSYPSIFHFVNSSTKWVRVDRTMRTN